MECLQIIKHPHEWVEKKCKEVQVLLGEDEVTKTLPKKFKARKILIDILEVVTQCKDTFCIITAAIIHFNIGILQAEILNVTEFVPEYFQKCLDLLEENELTPEGILPAITVNNMLGLIYEQRGLYEETKKFLKQAEDLYVKFTEDVRLGFVDKDKDKKFILAIKGDQCFKSILEKLHTLTLYYLTQVYSKSCDKNNFALYCHRALCRQLTPNKVTQNLDYGDWTRHIAIISQYFINQNKFPQARQYLVMASCILEKYLEILKMKDIWGAIESIIAEYKYYNYISANIDRIWAKYGIALLKASRERLLKKAEQEEDQENPTLAKVSNEVWKYRQTQIMEDLSFIDLKPEFKWITNEITDMYLLDFNDARPVIEKIEKWLKKAVRYYTFKNHTSDYARIVLDLSTAYKYMAFFEDKDAQAKRHKLRMYTLEKGIEVLCSRDQLIGIMWIERADAYSEILKLELDRWQASDKKSAVKMEANIERMARSNIKHYQLYLNSLEMSKSEGGVESFLDEFLYLALHSYFCIGKLYRNIISSNVQQRIENKKDSIDAYSFIVNYYDQHPEKQEKIEKYGFIKLSKDIITTLSHMIEEDRLRHQQMDQ